MYSSMMMPTMQDCYNNYQMPSSKYNLIMGREQQQLCDMQQNWNCQLPCPNMQTFNNNTLTCCNYRPGSEAEWYTLRNPIRCYENGNRGIWLCFDLHEYRPEEINVTLNRSERCITIEARQENKEQGISRQYCRRWCLPEYMNKVDLTKCELRSWCSPQDSYCYVECILPRMTPEECQNWPQPTQPYYAWQNMTRPTNCHPSCYIPNWQYGYENCCTRQTWPTCNDNSRPIPTKIC